MDPLIPCRWGSEVSAIKRILGHGETIIRDVNRIEIRCDVRDPERREWWWDLTGGHDTVKVCTRAWMGELDVAGEVWRHGVKGALHESAGAHLWIRGERPFDNSRGANAP